MDFSKELCTNGYVPVVKLEEKRSDVNFSVAVMLDAFQDKADSFFLFTGDTDQVGTIDAVRNKLGKRVCVFNPHESFSVNLKTAASYYQNIPRDLPAQCQLPDTIPYGKRGDRFIHRPAAW